MMIKRYRFEVCNCELGPHIDFEEDSLGDWVRFDDMPKWIPASERHPTEDDADEKGQVLCLHRNGSISTSSVDGFRYMTLKQYLGSVVVKWSTMPLIKDE
jgi:hypothetical protein